PTRISESTTKNVMSPTNKEDTHEGEPNSPDPRSDPGASPRTGDRPDSKPEKLATSPREATPGDAGRASRDRLCRRLAGASGRKWQSHSDRRPPSGRPHTRGPRSGLDPRRERERGREGFGDAGSADVYGGNRFQRMVSVAEWNRIRSS